MAQIRIKTNVGEITIDFTNNKDLETQLSKIDFKELESIVAKNVPNISHGSSVIEEYKDLYRLDSSGNVHLSKIPKKKADAIKLAVFLSESGLSRNGIKTATGISNPKAYMNKKDFIDSGDSIALETEARKEVLEKIIPKVRQNNQSK
ncbi:MAG: hypothetical protein QXY90_05810 [Candidatus Anstonellales archaeon]